jgi:hypothetical protein
MLLHTLPSGLENAEALIKRRAKAAERKDLWRPIMTECYRYAMPARETFTWSTAGQEKNRQLYDSTLQELTYEAANTMCAVLFPAWTIWANLVPGGAVPKEKVTPAILAGFQRATETFFDFLNDSNFGTVINECALDLMVGTAALDFDEGDDTKPFIFTSIPLSTIELEEGPDGSIETSFMLRKPAARNLLRMYPGLELFDLSAGVQDAIVIDPDKEVELIQGKVYDPETKKYFGVVIELGAKQIVWRYDYGISCPGIVARATKTAGELYGRGRVMQCLPDARTLDKMQEFTLRQAAVQLAPPYTAVTDGVMNPYTATIQPNTVIPVASNSTENPSLRILETGANWQLTEKMMDSLRERLRRAMLGPEGSDGQPLSATEISIADRNRLWAMNGEFSRIQAELLAKVITRGVHILQRKGLIPKFKIDGRQATVRYTSPFAKSQNSQDVIALQQVINTLLPLGPENISVGLKIEEMADWLSRKTGSDMSLVRTADERDDMMKKAGEAVAQATEAGIPVPGVTA